MLLVGSPMCTAFSTWQRINNKIRDPYVVECERKRAVMHSEFCIELYREQLTHGRYFLHEHPAHATSWQELAMQALMKEPGVEAAVCDQCMYGCKAFNGAPVKKPTQFLTNAPELAKRLRVRCSVRTAFAAGLRVEDMFNAEARSPGKPLFMIINYVGRFLQASEINFERMGFTKTGLWA